MSYSINKGIQKIDNKETQQLIIQLVVQVQFGMNLLACWVMPQIII